MNWYKIFYWLTVSDSVKIVFATVTIISLIFTLIGTIVAFGWLDNDPYEEWKKFPKVLYKVFFIMTIVFGLSWVFTPSKTDCLLIIAGGSVGNFIASDSSSQAIPTDITKFLHMGLQKQIQELGEDAKRDLGMQTPKEKFMDKIGNLTKDEIINLMKTDTTLQLK